MKRLVCALLFLATFSGLCANVDNVREVLNQLRLMGATTSELEVRIEEARFAGDISLEEAQDLLAELAD